MITIDDVKSGLFNGASSLVGVRVVGIHFVATTDNLLANYKRNNKLRANSDGFVRLVEPGYGYEPFCRNWRSFVCMVSVRTKPVKFDLFSMSAVIFDVCY